MAARVIDGTWDGAGDEERTPFKKESEALHKSPQIRRLVLERLYTNVHQYAKDPIGTRHEKASTVRGHKGLFEARVTHAGMIFRMLFDFDQSKPRALCTFQKKSQGLPARHVDHAVARSKLNRAE